MEFWRRKKARKCFLKNGSMFLKQLIADCNGISNPIRMFSSAQISKATNHFSRKRSLLVDSSWSIWYKGVINGRSYLIKRFTSQVAREEERAYNDIVLSARVSNHIGFLKLIGCCLEFRHPVLVFEDLEYTPLNKRGSVGSEDGPLLPWNVRLKIAKEVAIAITYLHIAFPRIIIHRHIKVENVFLDKNGTARLTDFSIAVTLPKDKTWIKEDTRLGTLSYMDRIYMSNGLLTEYSDVYSFGIFMLVLLMGRRPFNLDALLVDRPVFLLDNLKDMLERGETIEFEGDSNDIRPSQMKIFLDLALRCCEEKNEDRPKMILVAKELKLIEQASFEDDQI